MKLLDQCTLAREAGELSMVWLVFQVLSSLGCSIGVAVAIAAADSISAHRRTKAVILAGTMMSYCWIYVECRWFDTHWSGAEFFFLDNSSVLQGCILRSDL